MLYLTHAVVGGGPRRTFVNDSTWSIFLCLAGTTKSNSNLFKKGKIDYYPEGIAYIAAEIKSNRNNVWNDRPKYLLC